MIARIKGTQDFLDTTLYNYLIDAAKRHMALYNFTEIVTPILESTELFRRSLGLATDVVSKEMYTVVTGYEDAESSGGLCLRPEMTASVMRAFLNAGIQETPWKVYSVGPVFRHERPQKGRFRQFHQFTIEVIGAKQIAQDAYFILMLDRFFSQALALDAYALLVNFLGCPQDRVIHKQKLHKFLEKQGSEICVTCTERKEKNILRIFDCKVETCKALYVKAPKIVDCLCESCAAEWDLLQKLLHQLSVSYSYAPTLVRGLDYYNKTVFEFVSVGELGAQNAFCGGGRYDSLSLELGGAKDYPSVGAAMGIERMMIMLEQRNRKALPQKPAVYIVIPITPEQQAIALHVVDTLQAHDLCADVLLEESSVKNMMKQANKMGAACVIMIGSDEQQALSVKVKNMTTGAEETIPQRGLVAYLQR